MQISLGGGSLKMNILIKKQITNTYKLWKGEEEQKESTWVGSQACDKTINQARFTPQFCLGPSM